MKLSLFNRLANVETPTATESLLQEYFQDHFPNIAFENIEEIAAGAGVSPASVTRFVRSLGYAGFRDFSGAVREEVRENFDSPAERNVAQIEPSRPAAMWSAQVQTAEASIGSSITEESALVFDEIVELVRDQSRPLYLFSHASGRYLLRYFYLLARYHRGNMRSPEDIDVLPHELAGIEPNAIALISIFDRHPAPIKGLIEFLHQKKVTTILVTNRPASPLRQHADIIMTLQAPPPVGRFRSRSTLLVFLEALVGALENEGSNERIEQIEELFTSQGLIIKPGQSS